MKKKFLFPFLCFILLLLIGIGLMLYPLISNWYGERVRSTVEVQYNEAIAKLEDESIREAFRAAQEYNESLYSVQLDPAAAVDEYRNYVPATSQHIYPEPDNSGVSSWYIGNTFFLYSPNIANITYAHKLSTYIGSFYPYIITSKKRFVLFCHSGLFFVPIGKTPTEKALTRCVGLKVPNRLTVISAPSEKISFNLISYDGNRYL